MRTSGTGRVQNKGLSSGPKRHIWRVFPQWRPVEPSPVQGAEASQPPASHFSLSTPSCHLSPLGVSARPPASVGHYPVRRGRIITGAAHRADPQQVWGWERAAFPFAFSPGNPLLPGTHPPHHSRHCKGADPRWGLRLLPKGASPGAPRPGPALPTRPARNLDSRTGSKRVRASEQPPPLLAAPGSRRSRAGHCEAEATWPRRSLPLQAETGSLAS